MREILPFIGPLSFGLFADFNSLEFPYIGEIYIEASQRRQPLFQNLTGYLTDIRTGRLKIRIRIMTAKRETNGRHTFQATFNYHSHRTGIMHIHGRVIAVIDTTDYQIGFAVEHRMQGKFYAVYRSTGTFINCQPYIFTNQLVMNGFRYSQRTCTTRTRRIRRHHNYFSQRTKKLNQLTNAFCNDTIVIGNQY